MAGESSFPAAFVNHASDPNARLELWVMPRADLLA
jgi:hypothetical protein